MVISSLGFMTICSAKGICIRGFVEVALIGPKWKETI